MERSVESGRFWRAAVMLARGALVGHRWRLVVVALVRVVPGSASVFRRRHVFVPLES